MTFFGPWCRENRPNGRCFNLDQCDIQLIHHMIFGSECEDDCRSALITRIKDHFGVVYILDLLPHSLVESLRIVFTVHHWKILDYKMHVDIAPYLPALNGSDALLKALTAYTMAQNRVLTLPTMKGALSPLMKCF